MKQIICDTHLHSNHSHDSEASLESVCEQAIRKGLKVVCTTEHVFRNPRDVGYDYFHLQRYLATVEQCREKYKGGLEVLAGVEFSEPNKFPKALKALAAEPLDVIVGALHWMSYGFFGDPKVIETIDSKTLVREYYEEVLEMVNQGGFDTLAHMDLIKRYVSVGGSIVSELIENILKSLVRQNIALEINTSTIRRDNLGPAASYEILDAYLAFGGKRLTIGSDAHCIEDIGGDFQQIPEKYYAYIGYYKKRQFIPMTS